SDFTGTPRPLPHPGIVAMGTATSRDSCSSNASRFSSSFGLLFVDTVVHSKKDWRQWTPRSAARDGQGTKAGTVASPVQTILGDALAGLKQVETGSVQVCATSPPFYLLRCYGTKIHWPDGWSGELGHE